MKKERRVVELKNTVTVEEVKGYEIKRILKYLKKSINSNHPKTLIISSAFYILISLVGSIAITLNTDNHYDFALNIVNFMAPFYAITIGFSITSIVFVLSNLDDFTNHDKETLEQVITIMISYIILGLFTILFFLVEVIIGNLFIVPGTKFILNILFFAVTIGLVSVNFHLFYLIIKVLYMLSHSIINRV